MTVITTSTTSTATAYSNQRKIDRTSNGVLWAFNAYHSDGGRISGAYSLDNGVTWVDLGGLIVMSIGSYTINFSIFIDADDYCHIVYKNGGDGYIYYRRGTPNAARTAWTWSAATSVSINTDFDYPDIVAHREGTGWKAHVVMSQSGNDRVQYRVVDVSSSGTLTLGTLTALGGPYSNSVHKWPSIDFNHTGDGKTVKDGTPHLYVAWSAGATGAGKGIRFKKATYSGGSWTWGTEREIDSTRYVSSESYWLNCLFDGTRVIIGGQVRRDIGSVDTMLYDRDAGDTATTSYSLVLAAGNTQYLYSGSLSYDGSGNVYLAGRNYDGTSHYLDRAKWDRATTTLSARTLVDSGTSVFPYVSAKRGYSGNLIEFIYTDGTASPYDVTYGSITLNVAPNAPLVSDVGPIDRAASNRIPWTFSDPDSGDQQSAAEVRYASDLTQAAYIDSPTQYWDAPGGTFPVGDTGLQVRTADQAGVWGPWSATFYVTAADKPGTPTWLSPTNGSTISTETHLGEISVSSLSASEWRSVADNGAGAPDTGVVLYGPVEEASGNLRDHLFSFPVNGRAEHLQVRIKRDGLWSDWATASVTVSYTRPPVPVVSLTANGLSLVVQVTNPTPAAGEPAVTHNRVHVDDDQAEGETLRVSALPANGTWTYLTPRSGVHYEGRVRVVAVGDNDTTSEALA